MGDGGGRRLGWSMNNGVYNGASENRKDERLQQQQKKDERENEKRETTTEHKKTEEISLQSSRKFNKY